MKTGHKQYTNATFLIEVHSQKSHTIKLSLNFSSILHAAEDSFSYKQLLRLAGTENERSLCDAPLFFNVRTLRVDLVQKVQQNNQ